MLSNNKVPNSIYNLNIAIRNKYSNFIYNRLIKHIKVY